MMKISQTGIDLIKSFEGCRLTAYKDAVGVWTIGYGSTGSHVHEGLKITQEQAEVLLKQDLKRFIDGVNACVKVPITQNMFDALVSFSFNLGVGSLKTSTLLSKLNKKDYKGASVEFVRWNKAGGKVLAGLTRRRNAEKNLFCKDMDKLNKPVSNPVIHTVKRGENLTVISKKYKITIEQILKLNPSIKNANLISVGQKIVIKK